MANNWPDANKACLLGAHMNGYARFLFNSVDAAKRSDYEQDVSILEAGLMTDDRKRFAIDQYETRAHKSTESVSDYAQALTVLGRSALSYMTNESDEQINLRNRFIGGLKPHIREEVRY